MTQRKPKTKPVTFRVGPDIASALDALRSRDGIAPADAIRHALRRYLKQQGVLR